MGITTSDKPNPFEQEQFTWLLGIDCGHSLDWEHLKEKDRETKTKEGYGVTLDTGLSCVIPAWRLRDLLNSEVLVAERKQHFDEYCARSNGPVMED